MAKNKSYSREEKWLLEEKYGGVRSAGFERDCKRLACGEPLAYVIGFVVFLRSRIDLSMRPLIPRAETEWWVEKAIEKTRRSGSAQSTLRCLDIFSGSGCVGIALLRHLPNARVDCAEHSPAFIEQIKKNLRENAIDQSRVSVIPSDVFENISGEYDCIFANPPYISQNRTEYIQASVKKWEPSEALFAGDDGFFFIKKLLAQSPKHLKPGDALYIEFDSWQKEAIEQMLDRSVWTYEFQKDQFNNWRVCALTKKEVRIPPHCKNHP